MYNFGMMNGNGGMTPGAYPAPNPMADLFYVRINGDQIVYGFGPNQNTVLGYTAKAYEELLQIAEDYKKVLMDHGLIEKEKTPEELAAEQKDMLSRIMDTLDGVMNRLDGYGSSMDSLEKRMHALENRKGTKPVEEAQVYEVGHPENTSNGVKADRSRSGKAE